MEYLQSDFNFAKALEQTKRLGFYFGRAALTEEARLALLDELEQSPLAVADHITAPINLGQPNQVQQQHARGYYPRNDSATVVANGFIDALVDQVQGKHASSHPELAEWAPSEIGYQRYRQGSDFIGRHRDRASDRLLSVTCTLEGDAVVTMYESAEDGRPYHERQQIDEYRPSPGGIMLLRAPGFGEGPQIIHEVMPPRSSSRSIINLRMRPSVLPQPVPPSSTNESRA